MHRSIKAFLASCCCVAALLAPRPAQAAVTAAEVDAAITKGKAYLYSQQKPDGTWETAPPPADMSKSGSPVIDTTQWGGKTALAVYALLVIGERPTEPKLQKAIQFLHDNPKIVGTYSLAMKCQVWLHLPATPEVRKSMKRDAAALIAAKKVPAIAPTGLVWDYMTSPRKEYSFSRSQYAALGLWAAEEMDVEIPAEIWRGIEAAWQANQSPDGGFRYKYEKDGGDSEYKLVTMCMTTAGLATLYITQDFTRSEMYASARGNPINPPMDKAMKWITTNFKERVATGKSMPREFPFAMLYAIERVGLAGGVRRFGEFDWYDVGATWLIERQKKNKDGSFGGTTWGPIPDNAWGLLFLQRGRTPVAFNKLDYTAGVPDPKKAEWNQRPRDIANITRWLSRSAERELRWQIVGIDDTVNALLESPVLYISGEDALELSADAKAKLKAYCENGGLILANADGGNSGFAKSIEKLGSEIVPGAEWRELPDTHPLWANQNYKKEAFKTKVSVRGISNGVREMVLLVPSADVAKAWQLRNPKRAEDLWRVGANVLSYAVSINNYFPRGTSWLAPEPPATAKATKTVNVGRLQYSGKWDPEPQAWAQMIKLAKAKGIEVKLTTVKAGEAISGVDILHVTGATAIKLDDAARKAIKAFTDKGGVALFEAAGGNGEFAASAYGELIAIYGGDKLKTLPAKHAIYGTTELPPLSYRTYNIDNVANPMVPQLSGIEEGGKLVALLSKEDLTAGMLGVPTDGVMGYQAASAREVMMRVLQNAKK